MFHDIHITVVVLCFVVIQFGNPPLHLPHTLKANLWNLLAYSQVFTTIIIKIRNYSWQVKVNISLPTHHPQGYALDILLPESGPHM